MNTACGVFMAICRIDAQGDSLSCYARASEPARPLNDAHLAGVVLLGLPMEYIKSFLTFEQQADLLELFRAVCRHYLQHYPSMVRDNA